MNRTILIVDDEAHLRMLLQQTLEELEDEGVELADCRRTARRRSRRSSRVKPNLVFLDVMMPKLSGFDVCRRVKHALGLNGVYIVLLDRQGAGVRSAERAGGRRRPLHDEAVRSRRAAAEGARSAGAVRVMDRAACRAPPPADHRQAAGGAGAVAALAAVLGAPVAVEDADGRLLHGDAAAAGTPRFPVTSVAPASDGSRATVRQR